MQKNIIKTTALIIAVILFSCTIMSSCSPVEYVHYYQTPSEFAGAFNRKLMIPATAPKDYVMTMMWVIAEKYAMVGYEKNGLSIQISAFKGTADSKNPIFLEKAYEGEEKRTINGISVKLIKLITTDDGQLYNASYSQNGLNYIIDSVTEEQLEQLITSMTYANDITDIDTMRGYARVDYATLDELESAINLGMPIPPEIPNGFTVSAYYSIAGNIGVVEFKNAEGQIMRWNGSTSSAVYNYVNKYSQDSEGYSVWDNSLTFPVENVLIHSGDPDDSNDDLVYMATWFKDYFNSARFIIEFPEGCSRADFTQYSEIFYSVSILETPIYVIDDTADGTETETTEETTAE